MSQWEVTLLSALIVALGGIIGRVISNRKQKYGTWARVFSLKKAIVEVIVIVVDDDKQDLELMETFVLKKLGVIYKCYSDVYKAVNEIPEGKNVFVIDDFLSHPAMRGLDLIKVILEKNSGNFIILNTGAGERQKYFEYQKIGSNRTVYKNSLDWYKDLKSAIVDGIDAVTNEK